jgi:hypothetical protein
MLSLSRGELTIVLFIFGLVWSAGVLPRICERLVTSWASNRARNSGEGR